MIFNIAYAKKHFVFFVLKSIIRYNFFLIDMDDWWFVIVCCLIEDRPRKDHRAKHSRYCKDYHRSLDIFIGSCGRRRFLGVLFRNSLIVPRLGILIFSSDFWDPHRNSNSLFDSEDSGRKIFLKFCC
jgi:hypothetical protein